MGAPLPAGAREGWEAHRAHPPSRPSRAIREARQDARLLLMVVRARMREGGPPPFEHAAALARVAADERVQVRRRRGAAELLARLRLGALRRAPQEPV